MSYDPIEFPFQVHNDAAATETAYLCPEGLPWGATLEVAPRQADIPSGQAAIFSCRLTLDDRIIRPGCTNDQGFRLTAWRVAHDADEPWGSCFYFVRPRVRTRLELHAGDWSEKTVTVRGRLSLDSDVQLSLAGQLPLSVRVRLEPAAGGGRWAVTPVQASGAFALQLPDVKADPAEPLHVQAWFDRTDLLASSRSEALELRRWTEPVLR